MSSATGGSAIAGYRHDRAPKTARWTVAILLALALLLVHGGPCEKLLDVGPAAPAPTAHCQHDTSDVLCAAGTVGLAVRQRQAPAEWLALAAAGALTVGLLPRSAPDGALDPRRHVRPSLSAGRDLLHFLGIART